MKEITIYADFNFLAAPQIIGTLGYEHVRGNDHFVFKYSNDWLKLGGGIILSGDLMNVSSLQHPRGGSSVFGFVKDSFPDRWGRLLLDRRERILAKAENRDVHHRRHRGFRYDKVEQRVDALAHAHRMLAHEVSGAVL